LPYRTEATNLGDLMQKSPLQHTYNIINDSKLTICIRNIIVVSYHIGIEGGYPYNIIFTEYTILKRPTPPTVRRPSPSNPAGRDKAPRVIGRNDVF